MSRSKEKVSLQKEKKKSSLLDIFSKRASASSSISLRKFGSLGDPDNNVRRTRSQAQTKKLAAMRENEHDDHEEETQPPPQEDIYEEINFTDDEQSSVANSKVSSPITSSSSRSPTLPARLAGRRFTVEKVNEYETLVFNDEEKRPSPVVEKRSSPPPAISVTTATPPPSTSEQTALSVAPPPPPPSSQRPVIDVHNLSAASLGATSSGSPIMMKSHEDRRNSMDIKDFNPQSSSTITKSMNKPFRIRSKSMGTALSKSVQIVEPNQATQTKNVGFDIKRRTMLEVIRQIDNPVDFTASAYMEEEVEKVSPSHGANRRMSHHHAHMSTNGDTITKNGGVKFNMASLSSAAHEPSEGHGGFHGGGHSSVHGGHNSIHGGGHSSVHGGHNSIHGGGHGSNHGGHGHVKKEPTKIAVGISIVYGMMLASLGIFLSLDTMSGEIGSNRIVYTIFYVILYMISILWIIYLFYDIKRYSNDLNAAMEQDGESESNKIVRGGSSANTGALFSAVKSENNEPSPLYDTRDSIIDKMKQQPNTPTTSASRRIDRLKARLVDFTNRNFRGYLLDKNQPYNMYLRAGIGAFCLVTLLQCTIEISEGVENFVNGKFECSFETQEAILSLFQFVFSSMQFLFIFLKGNIVICINTIPSSILTMHLVITNLVVWVKFILLETLMAYYESVLHDNLIIIGKQNSTYKTTPYGYYSSSYPTYSTKTYTTTTTTTLDVASTEVQTLLEYASTIEVPINAGGGSSVIDDSNYTDCQDPQTMIIKKFALDLKHYMYPATIEFSITCATIFMIMWTKVGNRQKKNFTLLPTQKKFEGVGMVNMPYSNLYIMLDCTKTSKGLFFGVIVFVITLLNAILFIMFKGTMVSTAKILSEITEIILLVIALSITLIAFSMVRKHYTKVVPEANMFDVVLEIFSLFGIYAYSVNSLIALIYKFVNYEHVQEQSEHYYNYFARTIGLSSYPESPSLKASEESADEVSTLSNEILASIAAILSIVQGTFQTLFILECLRRYAAHNAPFMRKPARELITALLLTNVSMWFFDTLSAKRFDTKPYLIEHFGILKWSIINAFSAPIAIFYRFHSSVCLSDIWYGLYYGEYEEPENEPEFDDDDDDYSDDEGSISDEESQDSRF